MNNFRKKRPSHLKQEDVAKVIGTERSTISKWETGKAFPRAEILPKIAVLYGCTVDDLYGEKFEPVKKKSITQKRCNLSMRKPRKQIDEKSELLSVTMHHEIMKRFNEMQETLATRYAPSEKSTKPLWLDIPAFKEITGIGETTARAYFKNEELIRRQIIVKMSERNKKGGWLLNYDRWLKWANENAKGSL